MLQLRCRRRPSTTDVATPIGCDDPVLATQGDFIHHPKFANGRKARVNIGGSLDAVHPRRTAKGARSTKSN
jgi:hypothetical protein